MTIEYNFEGFILWPILPPLLERSGPREARNTLRANGHLMPAKLLQVFLRVLQLVPKTVAELGERIAA
jgi:hypothetical protein